MAIRGFRAGAPREADEASAVPLDASQRRVIDLADGESAAVVGAPGTGKTTTAVELVADRVLGRGWSVDSVVVLAATRSAATRLRDRLALRLGLPSRGPLARTVNSLAFEAVVSATRALGRPEPTLLTGPDQDAILSELLEGHLEESTGPEWPEELRPEVRRLRTFRTELREFMMRATEHGLDPADVVRLGIEHARPEWIAAAGVIDEYRVVLDDIAADGGPRLDSAELASYAVEAIRSGAAGERLDALRLVVVDDLQEASESAVAVLRALAERGATIVAFGDPDVATSVFRGGRADTLGRFSEAIGIAATPLVLDGVHRHDPAIRAVVGAATARIGAAASGRQRAASSVARPVAEVGSVEAVDATAPSVVRITAGSPSRETAGVARYLRERHLADGIAWKDMVVVVRSGAAVGPLARALAIAEVPTRTSVAGRALREDPAARALLCLVDAAVHPERLDPVAAVDLLTGPFGGLDRIALRRLRLALRVEELSGEGSRQSDVLLVEALAAPGRFATIDSAPARRAERLAVALETVRRLHSEHGSIEELLWSAWETSRVSSGWYESALGTGLAAAEANRNLDGVVALFSAARRYVERSPRHSAVAFIDDTLRAEVPEDTLAPRADDDTVLVGTPSAVVGLEYDVAVVARLQDGIWPNMRVRGSLLDPGGLVEAARSETADGPIDRRAQTLGDELRMFALATSRARRHLVLSAVSGDDETPSLFFRLLPPDTPVIEADGRSPLSLRGAVGTLRRALTSSVADASGVRRGLSARSAAGSLAALARARVVGAAPDQWLGLLEPSTRVPLFDGIDEIPVSPSKLEAFEESPLNWFIDSVSGSTTSTAMGIGTIVHWVLETAGSTDADELWKAVETRWGELLFEAPWLAERQRRATRILIDGLADYLADFARSGGEVLGAEDRFELRLALESDASAPEPRYAVVRGSIDRVERAADGSVAIVDLKTGRTAPPASAIAEHAQLASYQLALAERVVEGVPEEATAGGAKLLYVSGGVRGRRYRELVQDRYDEELLETLRERIRRAAIGMAAAEYEGSLDVTPFSPGEALRYVIHSIPEVTRG